MMGWIQVPPSTAALPKEPSVPLPHLIFFVTLITSWCVVLCLIFCIVSPRGQDLAHHRHQHLEEHGPRAGAERLARSVPIPLGSFGLEPSRVRINHPEKKSTVHLDDVSTSA